MEKDEEVEGMLLRQNQEKYYEFCRDLVPDVVGRNRFKARVIGAKPFMEVVTRSNEAFALLCFDNVLDICKEIVRRDCCVDNGVVVNFENQTRYTRGKNNRWCGEGTRRFNTLMKAVGLDRKERGFQFDVLFAQKEIIRMKEKYNSNQGKKGSGRKTANIAMEEIPWNDFEEYEMEDVANVMKV